MLIKDIRFWLIIGATAVVMLMFFVMYRGAFERRRGRPWLWFFALAAIGIYIKGPVGLLAPEFAGSRKAAKLANANPKGNE